jgi:UDPglucose 6-dehydrogenase
VIGMGHVGLTTAVCLSAKRNKVTGVDVDERKVATINSGKIPFREPWLEKHLRRALSSGFECVSDIRQAISQSRITFITVGTPLGTDGEANLDEVKVAAESTGSSLKQKNQYHLVVLRSTVPPRTTMNVIRPILESASMKCTPADFGLCVNPEFLREGSAIHDMLHPDKIVIGAMDKHSCDVLLKLYRDFYGKKVRTIMTSPTNAELIKYANNAFLATKISFINTIANMCQSLEGADVRTVAGAIGLDKRIGPFYLDAGLGFGGSCLPKDVKALVKFSMKELSYYPSLIADADSTNSAQPLKAVDLVRRALGGLKSKRIAVLGLSFKPDTDDLREAVSISIIKSVLGEGAAVVAYDPMAVESARRIFQDKIEYADDAMKCIEKADCCMVVTEWDEFKKLRASDFRSRMRKPLVVDGRRIYERAEFIEAGVEFYAVGLGPVAEECSSPQHAA